MLNCGARNGHRRLDLQSLNSAQLNLLLRHCNVSPMVIQAVNTQCMTGEIAVHVISTALRNGFFIVMTILV